MAKEHRIVYACELCLRLSEEPDTCHGRPMLRLDAGCPGDKCTKPIESADERLLTHAPRWWILRHANRI